MEDNKIIPIVQAQRNKKMPVISLTQKSPFFIPNHTVEITSLRLINSPNKIRTIKATIWNVDIHPLLGKSIHIIWREQVLTHSRAMTPSSHVSPDCSTPIPVSANTTVKAAEDMPSAQVGDPGGDPGTWFHPGPVLGAMRWKDGRFIHSFIQTFILFLSQFSRKTLVVLMD